MFLASKQNERKIGYLMASFLGIIHQLIVPLLSVPKDKIPVENLNKVINRSANAFSHNVSLL